VILKQAHNPHFPSPLIILSEKTLKTKQNKKCYPVYSSVREQRRWLVWNKGHKHTDTPSSMCTHVHAHTQINNKKVKLRRQKRQGEEGVQKLVLHKLLNGNK